MPTAFARGALVKTNSCRFESCQGRFSSRPSMFVSFDVQKPFLHFFSFLFSLTIDPVAKWIRHWTVLAARTLWAQAGGGRPSTAGSNPARVAAFPFSDVLAFLCLACQTSLYFVRPCGLMDKALVFGTKYCRFESCQGHFYVYLCLSAIC